MNARMRLSLQCPPPVPRRAVAPTLGSPKESVFQQGRRLHRHLERSTEGHNTEHLWQDALKWLRYQAWHRRLHTMRRMWVDWNRETAHI